MSDVFCPDMDADLNPEVSAAGFQLGVSLSSVMKLIGPVAWYEDNSEIHELLGKNSGWIGVKKKSGCQGNDAVNLTFKNSCVQLVFEQREILYQIVVGGAYSGAFAGVRVGDDLLALQTDFEIDFNDMDDEFLILDKGEYISGISFVTDHRASLLHSPNQIIKHISVHDWRFR
ncbi:hypothetical protein [Pseudomonas sp. A34-9]|uniref:hypothetical protein n=1 Tax=Pseudomonas sp. A34-9 TaxID=3034675 RepID=UPI00240E2FC9|nr:hypothetical protein [Pseudomonas sp. A34-9]